MTTSGTTSYTPSLSELMIESFERVQIHASAFTTDHVRSFTRTINIMLADWSNRGVNLWKVKTASQLLSQGVATYNVAADVVSIIPTAVYRRVYQLGSPMSAAVDVSTVSSSSIVTLVLPDNGYVAQSYVAVIVPISVGGLVIQNYYQVRSVIDSDTFTIDAGSNATLTVTNGGAVPEFTTTVNSDVVQVTLNTHGLLAGQTFTVQVATTVGGVTLQGDYTVASVIDLNNFTVTAAYVAGASATGFENAGECYIAGNATVAGQAQNVTYTDLLMYALSRDDYAAIPNKTQQGQPTSFWFDRSTQQTITLWQAPDQFGPYEMVYYYYARIEDAYPLANQTLDVPFRFFEAFCAEAAARLAQKWRPALFMALNGYAMEKWKEASDEDREKVSTYISGDFSSYFN